MAQERGHVSASELDAALELAERAYSPSDRELMARELDDLRGKCRAVREAALPETLVPAAEFSAVLPGMKLPAGKSSFRLSAGRPPAYSGKVEELAFASAVELSRLIRARKVTSTELTRMYLDRLKRYGPKLHCVVTLTEDLALKQAARADRELAAGQYRGPLHGIPWGAKDLLSTRGIRTTWGAKPYENQVFDYDATVVHRLEDAGAVLVAKLSLGELAMGDVWFGGLTRNPWKPSTGSSGSSAGPGSAVAAGLVGFSIGSETLGSIVSPSVVNGVTGLRPTFGRVPRYGAMALSWSMDKLGPMCRGVEDCAMVLAAICGPDGRDGTTLDVPFRWNPADKVSELKVGYDKAAFDEVAKDPKRAPVYAEVLSTLRGLGIEPRPITLPGNSAAYQALPGLILEVEAAASFEELTDSGRVSLLAQQKQGSWPNTFRVASLVSALDHLRAMRLRRRLQEEMAGVFQDLDAYVTVPFAGPTLVFTNLTGHPSLVTRCGLRDGMPESVEFIGNLCREDAVLRLGHAYEQTTQWHREWPDLDKTLAGVS